MAIQTVQTQEDASFQVTIDNKVLIVPDDMSNRHRMMIQEWVNDGGVIAPYITPPLPTPTERIATITSGNDLQTIIFKMLFKLHNRILVLERRPTVSVSKFLTFLEGELT